MPRPLAAAPRRKLPAHVSKDFVQIRRFSGDVALACERELQQRRCDGTLCRDGEQPDQRAIPTPHALPPACGSLWPNRPQPRHRRPQSGSGERARARGVHWCRLRRAAPSTARPGVTGVHVCSRLGLTRPRHGADDGGI